MDYCKFCSQSLLRMVLSLTTFMWNTSNPPWHSACCGWNKWQKVQLWLSLVPRPFPPPVFDAMGGPGSDLLDPCLPSAYLMSHLIWFPMPSPSVFAYCISKWKWPRHGHAVFVLWVNPPTSPCPTPSTGTEAISQVHIAGSDITIQKSADFFVVVNG